MVRSWERDEAVRSAGETLDALGRGGDWDSLSLAAAITDTVLTQTSVPSKYLPCLTTAALHLAIKMNDEAERVPVVDVLSAASGGRLSKGELLRMERAVVERLGWNLRLPSLDRFLHLLASVSGLHHLLVCTPVGREGRWGLSRMVRAVATDSGLLWTERASTLALALLSLHIEAAALPHWLSITSALQRSVGVSAEDVIRCREAVCARLLKRKLRQSPVPSVEEESGKENVRSPRKRIRRKTLPSTFIRTRTPVELVCIDDLADSLLSHLFSRANHMEVC